jgi:hypothetical protein
MKDKDSKLLEEAYTQIKEGRMRFATDPLSKEQMLKLNTKRLLAYMRSIRNDATAEKEWYDHYKAEGGLDASFQDWEIERFETGPIWWHAYQTAKEILSTREHID